MASLDDIFTTQKNGVVAINAISRWINNLSNKFVGTLFYQGASATSYTTLYTCPVGEQAYLTEIDICNTASTATTFSISVVPFNGTAGASNALFYSTSIPANTTVQWIGSILMSEGMTVQALAGTTTCTFFVTGALVV